MEFEQRKDRSSGSAGVGRGLLRERAAYFQLRQEGYSSREAAKIVGVHYRTARGWRNGEPQQRRSPGRQRAMRRWPGLRCLPGNSARPNASTSPTAAGRRRICEPPAATLLARSRR
ncbi:helix-turn-helix domain-containing protein [Micromonospora peucetia]|uniref:helix-turn-helix domain-containing protein n=1 Tax=Micromonospora peucetia TaxID=47871 RepID=UPI00114CF1EC